MAEYLSPGVYVKEVPSLIKPIVSVSTSVAGFIGVRSRTSTDSRNKQKTNNEEEKSKLAKSLNITESDSLKVQDTTPTTGTPLKGSKENSPDPSKSATSYGVRNADNLDFYKKGDTNTRQSELAGSGEVKLCTNFTEFTKFFGEFSPDDYKKNQLAHAVYGFFNNGGSRCHVMRVEQEHHINEELLERTFESIDEIAIVAAPGIINPKVRAAIITHCQQKTQDRFAIFDCPEEVDIQQLIQNNSSVVPNNSHYAAFYFPWIKVFDPASKTHKYVPPSGHIAGIYARVDTAIGVHKAPANEVIFGALGLKYNISKNQQQSLNPKGVNCIRNINGNYLVWGARTIGGDGNSDLKYINVRRTLLFLKKSINEGTQWVVFEPNTPNLWKRITRNVTDFLTTVWRSGALFGDTPQQAFYVKCDAETNPPEERKLGRVVTEIGVAIVRPAEFVIFRISQITPQTNS